MRAQTCVLVCKHGLHTEMNFSGKIFTFFYGLIVLVVLAVSVLAARAARSRLTLEHLNRYRALGASLAESLTLMEALGEQVSLNALYALRSIESTSGRPSDQELDELARSFGVTSFYITDEKGRFVRSSDTPLDQQTQSIFGFCDDYRLLLTGKSVVEVTPIVIGNPTPRPTKFVSIANASRDGILESSYDLRFIGKILDKIVQGDVGVSTAALFSPNGTLLGEMDTGGELHWRNRDLPFVPWFGERLQSTFTDFSTRVQASTKQCCECRIDGVSKEKLEYHYVLRFRVSSAALINDIVRVQFAIGSVATVVAAVAALLAHLLAKRLVIGLKSIEETAAQIMASGSLTGRVPAPSGQDEVFRLAQTFNSMMASLEQAVGKSVEAERLGAIEKVASQVAHDIRSPLAAVKMVAADLTQIPEDARCLMRSAVFRIEDIANHLLNVRKGRVSESDAADCHLASDIVETLVSEKRTEYREHLRINIEAQVSASAYGTFICVNATPLKNVLSNLINNAVDALADKRGHVSVEVRLENVQVVIEVRDDGCGIPEELLSKLGEAELTHGKNNGNGIGVASAQQVIKAWKGDLEYDSTIGQGTTARIRLPVAKAPRWFCPALILGARAKVVVLDDDVSIHHIWSERFERLGGIEVIHLSTPDSLASWLEGPGPDVSDLFLMDHELLGVRVDGLDLIKTHGLQEQSVLVTSRAQEAPVLARAEVLGVQIVPKSAAPHIPMRHMVPDNRSTIILIDDDHLVRRMWTSVASSHNKTVDAFERLAEFLRVADGVDPSTPIYVDLNLGNGERGDAASKVLHRRGFQRIFYATGDRMNRAEVPPWISGVCGKEGPF